MISTEWKQRNMIARRLELLLIGKDAWTQEQRDENLALELIWETVKMIRVKSDALEAINPIPEDFADDRHWV